jgi:phage host-nuclease inhibitor protein Gam
MARSKPAPIIVAETPQAEGALAEIAAINRKVAALEADMNAAIDAAKATASQASAPLLARRKELENAVASWAILNKGELFKGRKSLDLGFGTVGFRVTTKISQLAKITKEMTLAKLAEYGLRDGIRVKQEIDKEVMRDWPDERLELVGLRRRTSDEFYIEIHQEGVERAA